MIPSKLRISYNSFGVTLLVSAYSVNGQLEDKYMIEPWTFNPPHKLYWLICPSHQVQYSSQVTSRVHALRGMRAREELARAQGALEEFQAKLKSLES